MTTNRSPSKIIPRAFPGISPGEVAELINNSQLKKYPPNTILCCENELEDIFYLILEGEVEVTKHINNRENRLLKTLGAGDFFGEMALIHNAPRAATVRTLSALIALEINKASFDQVLQRSSSISVAMVREISRRLRENDEMAIDDLKLRASELAEAYQRMAEMEVARREFLTNVSHHLRTPLTAAGGYLQMLQKGAISSDQVPAVIDTIARNVQNITHLVNDILFVQEMDLILDQFEPVNLADLVKGVVMKYEEKASSAGIKVIYRTDPYLPYVMGDSQNLERAVTALVDNAIKFSPDKGDVEIGLGKKDEKLFLTVRDHGVGISEDVLPRIFDRYYHMDKSGSNVFDGLGIGLAITKQVIEQHKGHLSVESIPGEGSTFTVELNIKKKVTRIGKEEKSSTL